MAKMTQDEMKERIRELESNIRILDGAISDLESIGVCTGKYLGFDERCEWEDEIYKLQDKLE